MIDWIFSLPPYALFFMGALALFFLRGTAAAAVTIIVPIASFAMLLLWQQGEYFHYRLLGLDLVLVDLDRLGLLFAYLFHLAAFIGGIFAFHVKDKMQQIAALAYAGSAIGAVMAGDWISLFVFWELLALTSVFLIFARRTETSYHSGMRYLIVQVLSGVLLFSGALMLAVSGADLSLNQLALDSVATWLIFIAVGIKCGFPLFHTWIVDAYPEATPTGTVFLCAFSTKVGVYVLARAFAGEDILVTIGLVMACFPIFYAVIENDLRRVLAYSMINQIGFMVCGMGVGTEMAINGAVATAFNHVIYKGLLMMSMGAVLYRVGHVRASDLGGLYRSMPKTTLFCVIGAASISAFPLFSGFVSKSIIMLEMLKADYVMGWLLLLFAAAGVFHHAGIKVPFFAFFAHDAQLKTQEAPGNMLVSMGIASAICVIVGCYPILLYQLLPFVMDYSPYDITHVLTQTQLLFFSALAFVWLNLRGLYPPELPSVNLDVDWFYRRLWPRYMALVYGVVDTYYHRAVTSVVLAGRIAVQWLDRMSSPQSVLARSWTTASMLLALLVLLAMVLLFNFL